VKAREEQADRFPRIRTASPTQDEPLFNILATLLEVDAAEPYLAPQISHATLCAECEP